MSILELKKEIHNYIDNADDHFIQLIHGMVKADIEENLKLNDGHKLILEKRLQSHTTNPTSGSDWQKVKERVARQL